MSNEKKFSCEQCGKRFHSKEGRFQHCRDTGHTAERDEDGHDPNIAPDWSGECENCGQSPIVPLTGLCGPCTWGEAETIGGNW